MVAPRIVMLLHALLTGSLAALAAALGVAVEHTHEELPMEYRALLCGAVAAYCALGVVTALLVGKGRRWFFGRGVPSVLVPIAVLFVWPDLHVGAAGVDPRRRRRLAGAGEAGGRTTAPGVARTGEPAPSDPHEHVDGVHSTARREVN